MTSPLSGRGLFLFYFPVLAAGWIRHIIEEVKSMESKLDALKANMEKDLNELKVQAEEWLCGA